MQQGGQKKSRSSKFFFVSTKKFTCGIEVTYRDGVAKDGLITETAPILKRFIGQPSGNLRKWLTSKFPRDTIHVSEIRDVRKETYS